MSQDNNHTWRERLLAHLAWLYQHSTIQPTVEWRLVTEVLTARAESKN